MGRRELVDTYLEICFSRTVFYIFNIDLEVNAYFYNKIMQKHFPCGEGGPLGS